MHIRKITKLAALLLSCCIIFSSVGAAQVFAATKDPYPVTHKNTGVMGYDIVEVAKSQVGYTEKDNNITKYGDYFGYGSCAWCALFITWAARQAGIDESIIRLSGYSTADELGLKYVGRNEKRTNKITYKPLPGDVVFYDWGYDGYCSKSPASDYADHGALVEYSDDKYVYTIEGNYSDMVKCRKVALDSDDIKGYGIPSYNYKHSHYAVSEKTKKEATCTTDGTKECTCYCKAKYTVKISATGHKTATLPAVKATCKTTGLTAGKSCKVCHEIITEQKILPLTDHKDSDQDGICDVCGVHMVHSETVLANVKEATCYDDGYTGDYVCTECGAIVEYGEVIERLPHTYNDDWEITLQPTGKAEGRKVRYCTVCGAAEIMSIDKLDVIDISEIECSVSGGCLVESGQELKPKVTVKDEGTVLKEKTHYTLTYANNKKAGTGSVTVKMVSGSGYAGSTTLTFNIYAPKKSVTKASLTSNGKITYTCTDCGKFVREEKIYKISGVNLSSETVTYNGKVRTPSVIVVDCRGKVLKKGTDFTYTYPTQMKNPGAYKIKVTFKGNYTGTKTVTFTILPKATSFTSLTPGVEKATLKWKAVSGVTGYEVYYYSTFKKKYVKDGSTTKTSYSFTDLYSNKTYKLKVRTYKTVNGVKYYSAFSPVKTVKAK